MLVYIKQCKFQSKNITRDREVHSIMIMELIHQEGITTPNINVPNNRSIKYEVNPDRNARRNRLIYNYIHRFQDTSFKNDRKSRKNQ